MMSDRLLFFPPKKRKYALYLAIFHEILVGSKLKSETTITYHLCINGKSMRKEEKVKVELITQLLGHRALFGWWHVRFENLENMEEGKGGGASK